MGGIVSGYTDIAGSMVQANEDEAANLVELRRHGRQANMAIQGAQEKGAYESGRQRILKSQLVAQQRQAYGASGVDASQGTAAAVQADTAALGEKDAQTLAINAAREAWGYKEAKNQAWENYKLNQSNISNKRTMGIIGGLTKVASSMVSGAMEGGGSESSGRGKSGGGK